VDFFNHTFDLGLSPGERADLVAYLTAIGDGEHGFEPDSIAASLKEVGDFASVLDVAIPAHDETVIGLTIETLDGELRELTEHFPDRKDLTVGGGKDERNVARIALKGLVLSQRRIAAAVSDGAFDEALAAFAEFRKSFADAEPKLYAAETWSLFNPAVRSAHYAMLRRMETMNRRSAP